ncbi:MAG: VWA domain-containing protein [Verrucomicrobiota bacterium]
MSEGRRLPVYLVMDTSGSMSGEPIEAVRQGMKALVAELKGDPQALETAYLSVITFNSSAQQVAPLADLLSFQEPTIDAGGSTAFGEALRVLQQCVDREVVKTTKTKKGDWTPLIFLMTDGQPTDSWEQEADNVKQKRLGNLIACAAGAGADENLLKRVSEVVVKLNNLQPDTLKAFFKWVSSAIKTTSEKIAQVAAGAPTNLPPPPPQITIVP